MALEPKTDILTHQGVELRMKHAMVRLDKLMTQSVYMFKSVNVLHVQTCQIVEFLQISRSTAVFCTLELIIAGVLFETL